MREEAMVPAVCWEDGRFPQEVILPTIMEKHRLMDRPVASAIQAVVADGSAATRAQKVNPVREAPAMWMALHHLPITGNITLLKQRQG